MNFYFMFSGVFYLNHMGYKVPRNISSKTRNPQFYLNHMGYKVSFEDSRIGAVGSFYLNHMGYKVSSIGSNDLSFFSFI